VGMIDKRKSTEMKLAHFQLRAGYPDSAVSGYMSVEHRQLMWSITPQLDHFLYGVNERSQSGTSCVLRFGSYGSNDEAP